MQMCEHLISWKLLLFIIWNYFTLILLFPINWILYLIRLLSYWVYMTLFYIHFVKCLFYCCGSFCYPTTGIQSLINHLFFSDLKELKASTRESCQICFVSLPLAPLPLWCTRIFHTRFLIKQQINLVLFVVMSVITSKYLIKYIIFNNILSLILMIFSYLIIVLNFLVNFLEINFVCLLFELFE